MSHDRAQISAWAIEVLMKKSDPAIMVGIMRLMARFNINYGQCIDQINRLVAGMF